MFRSKAVKNLDKYDRSKLYLWWIETPMCDWWHAFVWFFKKPYLQIKKLIGWQINVFHNDYDYDGHSMFAIIEYKLKRTLPFMQNGHLIQESKDLKALKLAIKLAGRLKRDEYDMITSDRHTKKWGEMKFWVTPVEGSTNSMCNFSHPNAVTDEQKAEETLDRRAGYIAVESKTNREKKWFFDILNKYLTNFWD